jgi:hypothetical protein
MNETDAKVLPVQDEVNRACQDFLRTGVRAATSLLPVTRIFPEPARSLLVQSQIQGIAEQAAAWGICPRGTFLECDVRPEHYQESNREIPQCSISVPQYRRSPLR